MSPSTEWLYVNSNRDRVDAHSFRSEIFLAGARHIELLTEFAPSYISLTINIELLTEFRPHNLECPA